MPTLRKIKKLQANAQADPPPDTVDGWYFRRLFSWQTAFKS